MEHHRFLMGEMMVSDVCMHIWIIIKHGYFVRGQARTSQQGLFTFGQLHLWRRVTVRHRVSCMWRPLFDRLGTGKRGPDLVVLRRSFSCWVMNVGQLLVCWILASYPWWKGLLILRGFLHHCRSYLFQRWFLMLLVSVLYYGFGWRVFLVLRT